MLVNYDPGGSSQVPPAMLQWQDELGLHLVHIICDEPNAKVSDPSAITFFALVAFLPRRGDRIMLANGRLCQVENAIFKVSNLPAFEGRPPAIMLMPNIRAVLLEDSVAPWGHPPPAE
jgi:hypothetical protein